MDFHVFAGNVDLIWDEPDWACGSSATLSSRGSSSTTGAEAVHRRVTFPLRPSKPELRICSPCSTGRLRGDCVGGRERRGVPEVRPDLLPADGPSAQKSDVTQARLQLTRPQILAFRRQVGSLDQRMTPGRRSLRVAAWAGLQDSVPRAALLSIHARVEGTKPSTWEDSSLVQLWGPRFSVHVVAARDLAVFSLGRLPDGAPPDGSRKTWPPVFSHCSVGRGRLTARRETLSARTTTGSLRRADRDGRHPLGGSPGAGRLDRAATAGRSGEARLELARRYLHVFGPATPTAFARWAGIGPRDGVSAFRAGTSLTEVRTPIGDGWILSDEPAFRAALGPAAPARLLPSGDAYFLLQGADRELLVPDAARRGALWDRACLARRGPRRRRGGRHVAAGGRNGDGAALAPTLPRGAPSGRIGGGSLTAAGCAGSDRRPLGRRRPPRCFVVNAGSTRSRGQRFASHVPTSSEKSVASASRRPGRTRVASWVDSAAAASASSSRPNVQPLHEHDTGFEREARNREPVGVVPDGPLLDRIVLHGDREGRVEIRLLVEGSRSYQPVLGRGLTGLIVRTTPGGATCGGPIAVAYACRKPCRGRRRRLARRPGPARDGRTRARASAPLRACRARQILTPSRAWVLRRQPARHDRRRRRWIRARGCRTARVRPSHCVQPFQHPVEGARMGP